MDDCIGREFINKEGLKYNIIEYINYKNVKVKFKKSGYESWHYYNNISNGRVKDMMNPYVSGVGYRGDGIFSLKNDKGAYNAWNDMLRRCYNKKSHKIRPSYKDCTVCDEWHNFQNFAKWYYENYYKIENETMNLDKDILFKNNKVYSPQTCVFVNQNINKVFTKRESKRGLLPIGVYSKECIGRFYSSVSLGGKNIFLGSYNTIEDAFFAYKVKKENFIKQLASEYKDKIPENLYDAMYKYEVEITD